MAGITSPIDGRIEPVAAKSAESLSPLEAAKTGTPYAMTDLGNAERFSFIHRDRVKWDTASNCWRIWDGKRWDADTRLTVNRLAGEVARGIREEAAKVPTDGQGRDIAQGLFKHGIKSEQRDRLAAMIELAKARPDIAVAPDQLDTNDFLFNCTNGTLDLKTGELRPHRREDLITKLSPVDYQVGHHDERWENFLIDATGGDPETILFLQKLAGYCLTGSTSEEKAVILYGGQATGKSTFLEALRALLGDYARTINTDLLSKRRDPQNGASPELAGLAGARLACGSEMESGRELGEAFFKSLTGGESISARHLYAGPFEFLPKFKIILAVNHCPRASADDGAVWRRIVRIGIDKTVPPEMRDKTLKPYLRDPKQGGVAVFAWAVEGCLLWQREGLELPDSVRKNTDAYKQECDPLAQFIEDCLTLNSYAWESWNAIWNAYCEHADDIGTPERYRVAPKRLQARLKDLGATPERRHDGRGWLGIEMKQALSCADNDDKTPLKAHTRDASARCDTFSQSILINSLHGNTFQNDVTSVTADTELVFAGAESGGFR